MLLLKMSLVDCDESWKINNAQTNKMWRENDLISVTFYLDSELNQMFLQNILYQNTFYVLKKNLQY